MSPKTKSLKRKKVDVPPIHKDEEIASVFKEEVDVSDEDEEFIGNISNELNDSSDSEGSGDDSDSELYTMSEQLGLSDDDDDDEDDDGNETYSEDDEEFSDDSEDEDDLDSEVDTDEDESENGTSDSDGHSEKDKPSNSADNHAIFAKSRNVNKNELSSKKEKALVNTEVVPKTKTNDKLKIKKSKIKNNHIENLQDKDSTKEAEDEYQNDSSDEEDIRNTVGNVPMKWYDEYSHLGYDWDAKKIPKPGDGNKKDNLDAFLTRMEDPDFWRTVKDPQTGQDVILSEADIKLIHRIQAQQIPDESFEEYGPWIEWFTSEVMKAPLRNLPEHKKSFLPSKTEKDKVSKLVHALKMGWLKTKAEKDKERAKKDPQFYMLWSTDDKAEDMRRIHKHISAPKRLLPGHAESYNPPPEFLFDKKELKEWNKQKDTPWKRKLHFIPAKYDSLRKVPSYSRFIKERFLRCLDLYLCPRAIKMRLTIEPETLVPQLPSPKDLQPFPTTEFRIYRGHTDMIRCITIDNNGWYIATGSDDMTVKVWEVATTRCVKTIECGGTIRGISWCPNNALSLIAVAADRKLLLVNPGVGDNLVRRKTDELLQQAPEMDVMVNERVKAAVQWEQASVEEWSSGIRVVINHFKEINQVSWHGRGDYFSTVMPEGQNRSVLIHQLSKRRSQLPFTKSKGLVQCVLFHPIRPFLFVATQRNVRVYDLVKQELVKKLLTNSRWISCMAVHPRGDNLLVGTYDRKMLWFDLDLSTKPYQTLRLHGTAVRGVAFHKRYPLFASGSDDKSLIISHGMVYNDLLQNPLIVPVKRLQNHDSFNDFGILDVIFHPTKPWVFSAGADATVRLYS